MNRMKNRRRRRTGCIKHYPASKKSVDDAITSNEDRPELGGNRCIISGLTLDFALLGHFLQPEPLSMNKTPTTPNRPHHQIQQHHKGDGITGPPIGPMATHLEKILQGVKLKIHRFSVASVTRSLTQRVRASRCNNSARVYRSSTRA